MVAPVLVSVTTVVEPVDIRFHTCTYGGDIEAGDTIIVLIATDGGAGSAIGFVTPSGYTLFSKVENQIGNNGALYYKEADGTETGSFDIETTGTGGNQTSTQAVCVIRGSTLHSVQPPEAPGHVYNGSGSKTHNPPAVTPTGGSKEYLMMAFFAVDAQRSPSYPSNMTDYRGQRIHTGNGGSLAWAGQEVEASSFDPDVFTISISDSAAVWTVAIHPGAAAAPGNSGSHRKGPMNKPMGKPLGRGKRRAPDQPATGSGVLSPTFEWID